MEKHLIIHYGELGLKGKNKGFFEDVLRRNVMAAVRGIGIKSQIQYVLGRFVVKLPADFDEEKVKHAMRHVSGIEYFSITYRVDLDFDKISEALMKYLPRDEIADKGWKTFCVRVKKSQNDLPFSRLEAERDFGEVLFESDIGLKAKMTDPDLLVTIECFGDMAYIGFGKFKGLGGLPVGTGGKVLSLISSGFDSPVAAYRMIRRGAKVEFVHFSGQPYTRREEVEQVKKIVEILGEYQGGAKLYVVPFGEIQKKISINMDVPAKLRVVIYRRLMFKIAEKIARYKKLKALVTGESLGQVASQTLNNIAVIDEATHLPVFRPLIGMDKVEIINESQKVGTHDISRLPCTDTCSLFMPSNPEVSAKFGEVEKAEEFLGVDKIVNDAFEGLFV